MKCQNTWTNQDKYWTKMKLLHGTASAFHRGNIQHLEIKVTWMSFSFDTLARKPWLCRNCHEKKKIHSVPLIEEQAKGRDKSIISPFKLDSKNDCNEESRTIISFFFIEVC